MSSFEALSDPRRRRIVEMLSRGELSAGEIAERLGASRPAVSQHLKILRHARLVTVRPAGQQRIYELDGAGLVEIDEWLDRIGPVWQKRLEALERERHEQLTAQPRRWRATPVTDR